jgi:hypothetical protein
MKLSFSQSEVVAMIVRAIEEGWNPLGAVEGVKMHSPQSSHLLTLECQPGIEVKFTSEAIEVGVAQAFKRGVAPLKIDNPKLHSVTFHNSTDAMAKVDIRDEEIESRFGEEDEDDGDD